MLLLDHLETARRLPYAALVPAIATAARELAAGELDVPERLVIPLGGMTSVRNSLLCMPAVGADLGVTKIVTVHPQNTMFGVPAIQGEVIVFDVSTGKRLLLLDGPTVTARRTAAVTLLAIEQLAPSPPQRALLIGTGAQSAAHVAALYEYFGVRSIWVAGRQLPSAAAFCERARAAYPQLRAEALETSALASSVNETVDVVIALTTSHVPVVPALLPERTLAIGVGAFRPEMAELPPQLLGKRRIVVDHLAGARTEAGDLIQANINWNDVTELSQQLSDPKQTSSMPWVFKSVGHGAWDLAAARVALSH
jgi:1-piperideine-2-carboxylate/1-pyrroline-2-carboxylate reductase [NAD(P)H]